MKKQTIILTVFLVVAFFVTAGLINNNAIATIQNLNEDIPVEPFTEVGIGITAEVYIEQGGTHKLVIEADEETLDKIEVKVENGKLSIKPVNYGMNVKSDVEIYITAPEYEKIGVAGSAKLFANKRVESEELELIISGSGEMRFNELIAEETELKISGSGKAILQGQAEEAEFAVAGSGTVNADNFRAEEVEVKISGSGNCNVFAEGELDVSIAGSGRVLYRGNAEVDSRIAGSGSVKKL